MKEIKEKLKAIISKIESNQVDAWEDNLNSTREVIIIQDFTKGIEEDNDEETIKYNGWLEDLIALKIELENESIEN